MGDDHSIAEFHLTNLITSPARRDLGRVHEENSNNDINLSDEEINDLIAKLETSNDLSLISTALVVSAKCPDDRPAAGSLRALAYYSMNETFRLGNLGAIAFINVLRRHLTSATVCLNGCGALIGLLKEPSNKIMLVTLGVCADVVAILREHSFDRDDIAGWATTVVLDLADDNDNNRTLLGQAGVCEAVLDTAMAMRAHDSIARLCLAAIRNLATAHPENSSRFVNAGVEHRLGEITSNMDMSEECRLMAMTIVEIIKVEQIEASTAKPSPPFAQQQQSSSSSSTPVSVPTESRDRRALVESARTIAEEGEAELLRRRQASIAADDTDTDTDERLNAVSALVKIKTRAKAHEKQRAEERATETGTGTTRPLAERSEYDAPAPIVSSGVVSNIEASPVNGSTSSTSSSSPLPFPEDVSTVHVPVAAVPKKVINRVAPRRPVVKKPVTTESTPSPSEHSPSHSPSPDMNINSSDRQSPIPIISSAHPRAATSTGAAIVSVDAVKDMSTVSVRPAIRVQRSAPTTTTTTPPLGTHNENPPLPVPRANTANPISNSSTARKLVPGEGSGRTVSTKVVVSPKAQPTIVIIDPGTGTGTDDSIAPVVVADINRHEVLTTTVNVKSRSSIPSATETETVTVLPVVVSTTTISNDIQPDVRRQSLTPSYPVTVPGIASEQQQEQGQEVVLSATDVDQKLEAAKSHLKAVTNILDEKRLQLRQVEQRIAQEEEAMTSMQAALLAAETRCAQAVAVADRELAAAKGRINAAKAKANESKTEAERATAEALEIERYLEMSASRNDEGQTHVGVNKTTTTVVQKQSQSQPINKKNKQSDKVGISSQSDGIAGADVSCEKAATALGAGRVSEALRFFREALAADPRHHSAHLGLATLLMALGESDRALQFLRQAVCLRPRHAHSHYRLGCVHRELGQHGLAVNSLSTAAKLDPDNTGFRLQLARVLVQEGRYEEAMEEYQTVVRTDSANVLAHVCLGKLYATVSKDFFKAKKCFEVRCAEGMLGMGSVLLDSFDNPNPLLHHSSSSQSQSQSLQEAQRYFHRVVSMGPLASAETVVHALRGLEVAGILMAKHNNNNNNNDDDNNVSHT
eukprot:gene6611-13387_t